ncbi:sensor histidine kinase [Leptolyngbya sp. FACHB-261]|uniref:sensor histidine kinase n=1 Tax=Leptolyngbya sp. FACHB-261 TaxID=2692806 RepID=UPI0018EF864F|nr:sensor histidine kinase [Leptolyngbya sp. FACHB-261]
MRHVEWTILGISLLIELIDHNAQYWQAIAKVPHTVAFVFLGVFALLSLVFPADRPLWQRRAYIVLEIGLALLALVLGMAFDILLYVFIAKTCFLLKRKEVIITIITTGVAWNVALVWLVPRAIRFMHANPGYWSDTNQILVSSLINNVGSYLAASTFVTLLSFTVVAERKSRRRAELLAKEVETLAATLERTRIARDIHDSLGHTLTTLDVQLEVAQELRQRNPEKALQALDTAKLLASQCLQDVRRALQTMRRSDFNLDKALSTLMEQVQQNQSFRVQVKLNLPPLPLQTSHQLYCVVQEGLTNIQKHAQASRVGLRSWCTTDSVTLELIDDGQGFDPTAPCSGFGLRGMQERVQILDGELKIVTAPGRGTQIQVTVPR